MGGHIVLTKNEVKVCKLKIPAFFNFPAFFQFSRLFSEFPAFFGSSYHDVMNGLYEFNFSTTARHGDMK